MDLLIFSLPTWLVVLIATLTVLYLYSCWLQSGLNHLPGPIPLPVIGNFREFTKGNLYESDLRLIKTYGPVIRFYEGYRPTVIVADPIIIRQVMIKDFGNFVNRREMLMRGVFSLSVLDALGQRWKDIRAVLTPAFSSGKLKQLQHTMMTKVVRFVDQLLVKANTAEPVEARSECDRLTLEVVGSTSLGVDLDLQSETSKEFLKHANRINDFEMNGIITIILILMTPLARVLDFLGVTMFYREDVDFFKNLLKPSIKFRREQKHKAGVDLLQLMINSEEELREADSHVQAEVHSTAGHSNLKGLTDLEVMANSLLLLVAGFDTTSTTLTFVLYHLAIYPQVQDQLMAEVDSVMGNETTPTYEMVGQMTYMDQVINETLRLFPPFIRFDRSCEEERVYEGYRFPAKSTIIIPICALHRLPEVYPEPNKFDPDRFSAENKAARDPMYFMPFGAGPRECIAKRFALLELKLTLAKALKHVRFTPCDKTEVPLKVRNNFFWKAENGVWISMVKR